MSSTSSTGPAGTSPVTASAGEQSLRPGPRTRPRRGGRGPVDGQHVEQRQPAHGRRRARPCRATRRGRDRRWHRHAPPTGRCVPRPGPPAAAPRPGPPRSSSPAPASGPAAPRPASAPDRVVGERDRPARAPRRRSGRAAAAAGRPLLARLDARRRGRAERVRRRPPAPGSGRAPARGSAPVQTEQRPHGAGGRVVERLDEDLHEAARARGVRPHEVGLGAAGGDQPGVLRPRRRPRAARSPTQPDPTRSTAPSTAQHLAAAPRAGRGAARSPPRSPAPSAAASLGRPAAAQHRARGRAGSGTVAVANHSQIRSSVSAAGSSTPTAVVQRPPGPPDLLVVGDRRVGRADVDAEAEVGLVVAHAERRGRHDGLELVGPQRLLDRGALAPARSARCRPRRRAPARRRKPASAVRLVDGQRVDDAGAGQRGQRLGHPGEALHGRSARDDGEPQRGAGERAAQHHVSAPSCAATSAVTRALAVAVVASTGASGAGRSSSRATPLVVGPEVEAPVGDAVRLVDDEQAGAGEQRQRRVGEAGVGQPLGRDQQHVELVRGRARRRRRCQSSTLAELTVAARSPARSAAATWSRMSASSGETTSVGPAAGARAAPRWPPSRPPTCPSRSPARAAPAGRRRAPRPPPPGPAAVSRPARPSPRARPPAAAPPPRSCPWQLLCQPPPTEPGGRDGPVRIPRRMLGSRTGQRSATSMSTFPTARLLHRRVRLGGLAPAGSGASAARPPARPGPRRPRPPP